MSHDNHTNGVNGAHLRSFIERVEKLEEEKRAIADDIKDVYAEAKSNGFDAKIMRKVVSLRRMDRDKRREEEEILDLYMTAIGEPFDRTPLGAAVTKATQKFVDDMPPGSSISINGETVFRK